MSKRRNINIKHIICVIILVLSITLTLSACFLDTTPEKLLDTGAFSVHFIDVGQGDCTLIKTDKGNMLIDAGENGNETTILNYLEEQGVTELDYFVATHSHSDHIGGAAEIINSIKIDNIIISEYSDHDTQTYDDMLQAISDSDAKCISAKPGAEYTMGDVEFTVLSPFKDDNNLNNTSVTLKLIYEEHSFLFTGDAEKEVEEELLEAGYDLSADVYKLAHHGSDTSNSSEFLDAVNPELAIISYGTGNSYGHPAPEVIQLLEEKNINYHSTAESGNIIIMLDGDKLITEFIKEK